MGEPEALRAIRDGVVNINGELYEIVRQQNGHCDGCSFYTEDSKPICPSLATKVCCTGGYILVNKNT